MDIITYALLKKLQKAVKNGGVSSISSDGNKITFTLADGTSTVAEVPIPVISIDDNTNNWLINDLDTGVSANAQINLIEL